METATRGTLRTIAGQLTIIVGVVHLGLSAYHVVAGADGAAGDPRIVVWAVAGAVLVGGVAIAAVGWQRRQLYVVGLAVTGLLLLTHFLWPAVGSGAFYLGRPPETSMAHPLGYVHELVFEASPVAKIALATEGALIAFLVVLLSDGELR